ncbi:cupredoxin domain-containing protein [Streptomyces sp. NPDC046197]|uniref:cupredoxin domain-containing protein n=1 Tax=Streptomyces sp. NPDC046197 TaxID=3154337 RepID=UPI0033F05C8A
MPPDSTAKEPAAMSSSLHRRRAVCLVLAAAATLLPVTACSGGNGNPSSATSTAPTAPSPAARIAMKNFAFDPATVAVKAGQKVVVVNEDSVAHTVTATQGKEFDTGNIDGGKSGTFTAPSKSGSYPFVCTYHSNMKGTLIVR